MLSLVCILNATWRVQKVCTVSALAAWLHILGLWHVVKNMQENLSWKLENIFYHNSEVFIDWKRMLAQQKSQLFI